MLALVRSPRLLAQVLDHRGDPFGGSWGDVAGQGADQLLGEGPDLQVRVLGDPAEQREGFVGGEAEVVHEDPLGLLDGRLPGELLAPLVELAAQPLHLGQLRGQCRLGGVEQGERRGAVVGLQHCEGSVRGSDQPQVEPIGLAGGDQDRQRGHGQVVHLAQVQDDRTLLARPLLHPGLDVCAHPGGAAVVEAPGQGEEAHLPVLGGGPRQVRILPTLDDVGRRWGHWSIVCLPAETRNRATAAGHMVVSLRSACVPARKFYSREGMRHAVPACRGTHHHDVHRGTL